MICDKFFKWISIGMYEKNLQMPGILVHRKKNNGSIVMFKTWARVLKIGGGDQTKRVVKIGGVEQKLGEDVITEQTFIQSIILGNHEGGIVYEPMRGRDWTEKGYWKDLAEQFEDEYFPEFDCIVIGRAVECYLNMDKKLASFIDDWLGQDGVFLAYLEHRENFEDMLIGTHRFVKAGIIFTYGPVGVYCRDNNEWMKQKIVNAVDITPEEYHQIWLKIQNWDSATMPPEDKPTERDWKINSCSSILEKPWRDRIEFIEHLFPKVWVRPEVVEPLPTTDKIISFLRSLNEAISVSKNWNPQLGSTEQDDEINRFDTVSAMVTPANIDSLVRNLFRFEFMRYPDEETTYDSIVDTVCRMYNFDLVYHQGELRVVDRAIRAVRSLDKFRKSPLASIIFLSTKNFVPVTLPLQISQSFCGWLYGIIRFDGNDFQFINYWKSNPQSQDDLVSIEIDGHDISSAKIDNRSSLLDDVLYYVIIDKSTIQ